MAVRGLAGELRVNMSAYYTNDRFSRCCRTQCVTVGLCGTFRTYGAVRFGASDARKEAMEWELCMVLDAIFGCWTSVDIDGAEQVRVESSLREVGFSPVKRYPGGAVSLGNAE